MEQQGSSRVAAGEGRVKARVRAPLSGVRVIVKCCPRLWLTDSGAVGFVLDMNLTLV